MTILDISYWEQFPIKSYHNMNRYLNFIKSRIELGDRKLEYSEKHHIVPKSFNQNAEEAILLTPREHFIAHKILSRCFSGRYHRSMIFAFRIMVYGSTKFNSRSYKISSKDYNFLKIENSKAVSIDNPGKGNAGKPKSEQHRKRIGESQRGKIVSSDAKKRMSENHADFSGNKNPMYGKRGSNCPHYGKKMINNGKIMKMIPESDIELYLSSGWKLGRLKEVI